MIFPRSVFLILALALLFPAFTPPDVAAGGVKIKFATLAPDGSTWMKVMKEMAAKIKETTEGRVRFKIYPGGVAGDEKDVVRKMRLGQLHSAGFSGVGLGEILPLVRVLDLPFLFNNPQEVDYIEEKYFDYFSRAFEKKGHILLGWAEIGSVYIFSGKEIRSLKDMKDKKMWMWEGDPLAAALFKGLELAPYPLSITDVLMALQTGMIDTIYVSPLGAISLQWNTRVKYMLDLPMAVSAGAVTITKKRLAKLSPEDQKTVLKTASIFLRKLTLLSRRDNKQSIKAMRDYGLKITSLSNPQALDEFRSVGVRVRRELTGKLYPEALIQGIIKDLELFRKR